MLGVSLVSADDWILRYFASGGRGRHFAAELCQAPVRGADLDSGTRRRGRPRCRSSRRCGRRQAQALCRHGEPDGVSHIGGIVSGVGVDDGGGAAHHRPRLPPRALHLPDAQETATYFFWFAISLALWSAQAQYARAFYAAGDTLTPMIASTIIVVASLPVYRRCSIATA